MSWKTMTFERESLYKEVWAEPVRTVAHRYGISDVGLRKICGKLGVPLPPLGYWAKVAAGKHPRVTPLPVGHSGDTRYLRQIHIDEAADERSSRVQTLLNGNAPHEWPVIGIKSPADELHPVIRRTERHIGKKIVPPKGLLESRGLEALEMRVSPPEKERALRILDALVCAAVASGAAIVGSTENRRPRLQLLGVEVDVRLEEELDKSLRQPTPAEKSRQARESWYKPDLAVYEPTGSLRLFLLSPSQYNPLLTARFPAAVRPEEKLLEVIQRLWDKVAHILVDEQMRAEEHERWNKEWARREELQRIRQGHLDRLEKTKKFAAQWRQAAELRSYADALERAGSGPTAASEDQSLNAELTWIRTAADWLDPLTRAHWPEVDGESIQDEQDGPESGTKEVEEET